MTTQPSLIPNLPSKDVQDKTHEYERQQFNKLAADHTWFAMVDHLIHHEGWYWRDAVYIAWYSVPLQHRVPKHLYKLEEMLGMKRGGMSHRRQKNPQIDVRASRAVMVAQLYDSTAEVLEALTESAKTAGYKHHPDRKLFLTMAGLYQEKQGIDVSVKEAQTDLGDLSNEELARLAGRDNSALLESGGGAE